VEYATVASGDIAMRWPRLLILALLVTLPVQAFAVPHSDAEEAYASGDYKTAFALWLPLAEQGSARAQTNIARMYERGDWVAQDPAMAAEWYRRAADQTRRDATNTPTTTQAVVPQQTAIIQPPPVYTQPTSQPVYSPYPVARPMPQPFFVPSFHRHWRR
jgi:hypothetical protein